MPPVADRGGRRRIPALFRIRGSSPCESRGALLRAPSVPAD